MSSYGTRRPPDPGVGEILAEARTRAGLTQAALAEESGLSLSLITKVESGQRDLGRYAMARLIAVLGWDEFGRAILRARLEPE